jgi:ABC transporter substrate binding protein
MRRREVITLLGAATAFWPFVARAQQPPKLRTIGFLGPNTAALDGPRVSALVQRLHELGWIEGRTIAIEYRWAEGRNEHLAEIAAEFVRLKVDVIVTSATPTTVAVKKATSSIPVVFASVGDPIGAGLVASLARPSANVTGLSLQMSDTAGKRLGIMREVVPALHHVAIMANGDNASAVLEMREARSAAGALGLDAIKSEIRRPEDIAPAVLLAKLDERGCERHRLRRCVVEWPEGEAAALPRGDRGVEACPDHVDHLVFLEYRHAGEAYVGE